MAQVNSMAGRLKSERGAELIEFALIFPLLLLVMVGIFDFGFLFQRYEVLTNAAREGARMAVLPNYSQTDVQNRVCAYLTSGGVPNTGCTSNPVVTVTDENIPVGGGLPAIQAKRVQVVYTHTYSYIGPIISLIGGSWTNVQTITTTAVMRTEIQDTTPTP